MKTLEFKITEEHDRKAELARQICSTTDCDSCPVRYVYNCMFILPQLPKEFLLIFKDLVKNLNNK